MVTDTLYASFMVRLWCQSAGEAADRETPAWAGEIECIQNGRVWQFQSLEHLLHLLAAQLAEQESAPP